MMDERKGESLHDRLYKMGKEKLRTQQSQNSIHIQSTSR